MDPTQPAAVPVEVDATVIIQPGQRPPPDAQERADVSRWMERVRLARKHDEEARKQYARDRRYARGDSGFQVDANLLGTYIDITESFLYAKNPDVDVRPAKSAEPPSLEAMRDAAEDHVDSASQEDVEQVRSQVREALLRDTGDPMQAITASDQAAEVFRAQLVAKQFKTLRKRFQRRQRDNKAFADTLEIVVSKFWKDARLKARGCRWVRSALTVGLGVLKASWQERTASSPQTMQQIHDLMTMIGRLDAKRQELNEAFGEAEQALRADYERQLATLQAQSERVVARGFVIDLVPAEDFQVAPGFAISDHTEAPWNSHQIPMLVEDARAKFKLTELQVKQATRYVARKPETVKRESALVVEHIAAEEASSFMQAGSAPDAQTEGGDWLMVEEIWDATSGQVLTGIHGVQGWVAEPWTPPATTRFYPFFVFCLSEVDGQRHPQSLVTRSAKLIDEYNRIGSAEAEHRRRSLPGVLVHGGQLDPENLKKVTQAQVGEYTVIDTTMPNTDLRAVFFPKTYAQIDLALYDRQRIVNELERIWGIQEALSGAVNNTNTATEATIQQQGFNARTGGRRDGMEMVLGELAQYTAEVLRAKLEIDEVRALAGPDAMWPAYTGPDDLANLVVVDIAAGSSGKPDTAAERAALAQTLPLLQAGITQIGQLRGSSQEDIADALEAVLKLAVERAGDPRLDLSALLPQAGEAPVMPPMPMPGAAPGVAPLPGAPGAIPAAPAIPDTTPAMPA